MGGLVEGDDGLPAEEVGPWAKEKHDYLCRYVDISRGARKKFIGPGNAGATYIDLFCGPGRARVNGGEFIDGSCVAAWKKSVEGGSPFSGMLIADLDQKRLDAARIRLEKAGAPVETFCGKAVDTAASVIARTSEHGLHFAFLDPFNLADLDFRIFELLSRRRRMDIMAHLSKMDLQRNLSRNISANISALDAFSPGWREFVAIKSSQRSVRIKIIEHWQNCVSKMGFNASKYMKLIKGSREQHLYWLLLISSHELAHKFWNVAANTDRQGDLFK